MDDRIEATRLLAINTGSSSLKAGVYRAGPEPLREASVLVDLNDGEGARVTVHAAGGQALIDRRERLESHASALVALRSCLQETDLDQGIAAIGHRIVHGGRNHDQPALITPELLDNLHGLVPLAPEHLPQALAAVEALGRSFPGVPQVACFDTAFHRTMPRVAQLYGLPSDVQDAGVLRYGFHGLSCESIVQQLDAMGEVDGGRVVIAHLGNGSSMTAVRNGRSVETTMGFTPTGGLVMASRSGDLDPGVLLFLLRERALDAAALGELVNRRSGLLGVSETSGDMRELLDLESSDPRAAEAVALFCYHARKAVGALATALGGLDTLVFTGGIGEHAAPVRERICSGLGFLSIEVDHERNLGSLPVISPVSSPVTVRVVRTNEELMIVRHTAQLLGAKGGTRVPV